MTKFERTIFKRGLRMVFTWAVLLIGGARNTCAVEPPVTAAVFTPDGRALWVAMQGKLTVYQWPQLRVIDTLDVELWESIHDLALSPDGTMLAVAGGDPAVRGGIVVLSASDRRILQRSGPHDDVVNRVAWSDDGQHVLTAGADQHITIYAAVSNGEFSPRHIDGHVGAVTSVALLSATAADALPLLLSAGEDKTLRLWKLSDDGVGPALQLRTLHNHTGAVTDVAPQPNGDVTRPLVASSGEDGTVRFWQPTIGRLVRFAKLDSVPLDIAWTADGRLLIAACRDGRVRAIAPQTACIVHDQAAVDGWAYTLVIAPDDRHAVVGGERGQLARIELPSIELP